VTAYWSWVTILHINELQRLVELDKVCSEIKRRDPSFEYETNVKRRRIFIYSKDRDVAHKRGMWFHHKFGVYYDVEMRGVKA